MDYTKERIKREYVELKALYTNLYENWEKPKDWEDLYKIRVNLIVLAVLLRGKTEKPLTIKSLRDIKLIEQTNRLLYSQKEIDNFIYSDSFKNKIIEDYSLDKFCNYLIHEESSHFSDDRINYTQKKFEIYYCVKTDKYKERMFSLSDFINKLDELTKDII